MERRSTPWLKTDFRPVENGGDGLPIECPRERPPPRRPDWSGIAVYASVQGVFFGLLAIGYGAISRDAGEQFAGLSCWGNRASVRLVFAASATKGDAWATS
jgi:hypothetical protein